MRKIAFFGAALLLIAAVAWMVQANGEAEQEEQHGFVGVRSCMACHKNPAKGEQYTQWLAGPHAHAYQILLSDESKKICLEMDIEAAPEEAPECLRCHVTGWDAPVELLGKKYDRTDGVGCESCHGAAKDWKRPHMKNAEEALTLGMIVPDEALCRTCHNEDSPTYQEFDYKKKLAIVAHPNPQGAEE